MLPAQHDDDDDDDEVIFASWLVGWILWHINLCRLFNAKSIFIQIVSCISNNLV